MTDLWTAYLNGDERLVPFFAHRPGDWASVVEARNRADAMPLDAAAVEEVARANECWGVAPSVVERIALLDKHETRVVVTGQQIGLLGGPLFTLYKMIAAVRWAEQLEGELGVAVVPVFWPPSEDHDFDEVRSFRWRNAESEWQTHSYSATSHKAGKPVCDIAVESRLCDDLAHIFTAVRQTEFTSDLASRTCEIAEQSRDLEDFFIRVFAWLLGDRAPVFVSPRMNWIRRRAAAILERELAAPGESSRRIIDAAKRLRALGFQPGLHRRPEHVNCFVHRDGLRHAALFHDDVLEIVDPGGGRHAVEAGQLSAELSNHPDRFSANVGTRPIIRDSALPTIAYVAGPGEVAYLVQLRGVYELFNVPMPMILPRPQLCLIEPRVERALDKFGVGVEAAVRHSAEQFDALVKQRASTQIGAEAQLETARGRIDDALDFVGTQVDLSDPAVKRAFDKLEGVATKGMDKLAERQRRSILAHDAERSAAAATAHDALWPGGRPQERALTIFFPFLNLFGTRLVERLVEAIDLDARDVQPIRLASLMAGEDNAECGMMNAE